MGALANLGHQISDQTLGNILRRNDVAPAPKRSQTTTWKEFIRRHMDVLAGTDFFTVEVLTRRGLVTYYVLFFLHAKFCAEFRKTLASAGITCLRLPARSPNLNAFAERWVCAVKR